VRISPITIHYNTNRQKAAFCGVKDIQKEAKALIQTAQTQFKLNTASPVGIYNSLKVLKTDPEAFVYGICGRSKDILKSKDVLGAIQIQKRGQKDTTGANALRFIFEDGSKRYSIRKFGETLAYVDVTPEEAGNLYISYLCNVGGRDRYRSLEKTVLQAAVEDTINQEGAIPTISAIPAKIGDLDFNRSLLYRMMGGQVRDCNYYSNKKIITVPEIYCSQDTITKKLDSIAKRDKFLFPETRANFEKLKNGGK